MSDRESGGPAGRRLVIVGSGTKFISGISYYTHKLAVALAGRHAVAVILMRTLIPAFLYPGRDRVGAELTEMAYPPGVEVHDGVDWHGWGLFKALRTIGRQRPETVILQWWTGAVLHLYIVLALWARLLGARIVVEYHEVQDTGEVGIAGAARYVALLGRWLMSMSSGSVVHSSTDIEPVCRRYGVGDRPLAVIPHGPFDQYPDVAPTRQAPPGVVNLLFFGTIRPYKGLEDLVAAFNALPEDQASRMWLTVAGETWEGWSGPLEMIEASPHRDRITLINRYLTDAELAAHLAGADAVVLPYRRSSASGPLHVAMARGLPVIVTEVGGLPEAAAGYEGAVWIPAADPQAITEAFAKLGPLLGRRFKDPQSWAATAESFERLLAEVQALPPRRRLRAPA